MRRSAQGFALLWALILLASVASVSSSSRRTRIPSRRRPLRAARSTPAFFAADGGIAQARWRLARDGTYEGEALDIGTCRVEIRVFAITDGWEVEAAAEPGHALIRARLRRSVGLPPVVDWKHVR